MIFGDLIVFAGSATALCYYEINKSLKDKMPTSFLVFYECLFASIILMALSLYFE